MNLSSDSLPPPPAFLLETSSNANSPHHPQNPQNPHNVAETVKALTDLRHMPASPGVLRRAQQQMQIAANAVALQAQQVKFFFLNFVTCEILTWRTFSSL